MQDSLNYTNDVVKKKQAKMRDFISQTGQKRDYFREQNYADKNIKNSLTSLKNNGIIESKSKSFIKPITNETIENIPLIQLTGFSIEDATALQNAHKTLLKEAQKHPLGTECSMILGLDMEQIDDIFVGGVNGANIPFCSDYHIALHNHPSGETFSIGDMKKFADTENMQILTALGNNGKVYAISKTISFDSKKFKTYLNESQNNRKIFKEKTFNQINKEFVSTLTTEEKEELKKSLIQFSEEILKEAELYGVVYNK